MNHTCVQHFVNPFTCPNFFVFFNLFVFSWWLWKFWNIIRFKYFAVKLTDQKVWKIVCWNLSPLRGQSLQQYVLIYPVWLNHTTPYCYMGQFALTRVTSFFLPGYKQSIAGVHKMWTRLFFQYLPLTIHVLNSRCSNRILGELSKKNISES